MELQSVVSVWRELEAWPLLPWVKLEKFVQPNCSFTFHGLAVTVHFFARVALGCFANSEGLGLLGNDLLKGLAVAYLSSVQSFFFFLRDGKGPTSDPHELHFDIWVVQSFLKVCMPFSVQMVTLTSCVFWEVA